MSQTRRTEKAFKDYARAKLTPKTEVSKNFSLLNVKKILVKEKEDQVALLEKTISSITTICYNLSRSGN